MKKDTMIWVAAAIACIALLTTYKPLMVYQPTGCRSSCSDPDGDNPYLKATLRCSGINGAGYDAPDQCTDYFTQVEETCQDSTHELLVEHKEDGYVCKDGALVKDSNLGTTTTTGGFSAGMIVAGIAVLGLAVFLFKK
jgi:hypothetical protein